MIGIIFSCERWGLECARGDIQCGPTVCPRLRPPEEKSKLLASLACASEAANEQLERGASPAIGRLPARPGKDIECLRQRHGLPIRGERSQRRDARCVLVMCVMCGCIGE